MRGIELDPGRGDESWVGTAVRFVGYCWVTCGCVLWYRYGKMEKVSPVLITFIGDPSLGSCWMHGNNGRNLFAL